ncbi:Scr1 family TA system antitoxin-like transcriptional regulator [Streptomyces sp. NPDC050504]|uniref:helix-turn-helix domain-containing protein n=1 Tax=Streptomyces sp. NPDC050504 TaxID=3365618 RepID=UPI0037ACC308
MARNRELDPSASALDHFGSELRHLRVKTGDTQDELGTKLFCTGSLIGQIETARKVPTREFAERVDQVFNTGGEMGRLVGLVLRSQLPSWFRKVAGLEAKATYISIYEAQVVYGLLQTKDYARAVMGAYDPNDLDTRVEARMERQRVLSRENPPALTVVMDEGVLRREVGSRHIMWNQLAHLLSFRDRPDVNLQILPFKVGAHAGQPGMFTLLRFDNDPDIVYTEDFVQGHATANPATVREGTLRYAHLQAAALSVEDSAAEISRVMEERYGSQSAPDERGLA